jgi:hypothetical protein
MLTIRAGNIYHLSFVAAFPAGCPREATSLKVIEFPLDVLN